MSNQQQQRRQRYWPIQWFNALDGRLHPINSLPPVVPKLCIILLGQTRTFRIVINIIPPCLPRAFPPSHSLYLHVGHPLRLIPSTSISVQHLIRQYHCHVQKHLSPNHKAECIQSQLLSELFISPFIHSEQTHMSIWSCSVHDNQQQEINNYACRNTKPLF